MTTKELTDQFCTALLNLNELAWAKGKRKLLPLEIERMFILLDNAGDNCWDWFKQYDTNHWREETRMWPRIDKWLIHNDSAEGNIRKTLFVFYTVYKCGGTVEEHAENIENYCTTVRATKRIWTALSAIPNYLKNPQEFVAQEERDQAIEIGKRLAQSEGTRRSRRVSMFGHLAMMSILQMGEMENRYGLRTRRGSNFADVLVKAEQVIGFEKTPERNLMKESMKRK